MVGFAFLVVPLFAGMLLGFALRGRRRAILGRVTFGVILVLIFSLGFSIGSNSDLLSSLSEVGLTAIVVACLTVLFSVVLVSAVRKAVRLE
jgi:uncharacterized membrane protein YbjE (DUF340 family)